MYVCVCMGKAIKITEIDVRHNSFDNLTRLPGFGDIEGSV